MTVNDTIEAIAIMQAFTLGKEIEVRDKRDKHKENWMKYRPECGETPAWNWQDFEYRYVDRNILDLGGVR